MINIQELQETVERLVFKYNIKKEYFTILLPVLIGLAIVVVAFLMGHTIMGFQIQQKSPDSQKHQDLQQLMQQLNDSGDSGETQAPTPVQPKPVVNDLDHYIIYGIIVALVPYSIDRFFVRRRHAQYEDDFTQFLFKLSEMMRAGIDPIKSVIELSKTDLGSLTPHVKTAASMMLLGRSFEEGMKSMAASLHSEMISKYIDLVVQASYMGGSVHDLILKASEDMRTMIMIEREMLTSLSQYTMIFYLAQGIMIVIAYILSTQLIPFIQGPGASAIFGKTSDIQNIDFTQSFFHLIMITAAIGGIIIGKISEGSMEDGFKHTVIMMSASYIICVVAILPLAGAATTYTISVVSGGDQIGIPGSELPSPIVFKVVDGFGNKVTSKAILLDIKPGGSVDPAYIATDSKGQIQVHVKLGENLTDYNLTAQVSGFSKSVIIKTKDMNDTSTDETSTLIINTSGGD